MVFKTPITIKEAIGHIHSFQFIARSPCPRTRGSTRLREAKWTIPRVALLERGVAEHGSVGRRFLGRPRLMCARPGIQFRAHKGQTPKPARHLGSGVDLGSEGSCRAGFSPGS